MSLFHFGDTAEHGHTHGTVIEKLDPRVKLVCAVGLALWVGLLPAASLPLLGFLVVGMVVVGGLAEIPPATLLVRAAGALPFVLLPAGLRLLGGDPDLPAIAGMAARGCTAAMVATLLVSVAPCPSLLAAGSALGAPDLLVQTTALVYRYLLVLRERAGAMVESARARGFGPTTPRRMAVSGAMLGALLLRSLDRAERVNQSMLARGYTGRFPVARPMRMRAIDWWVGAAVLGGVASSLALIS